jgi:hypothetical protein
MVYGTQTQIIHFERGLSFASMSEAQSIHAIQVLVEDTAFIDLQGYEGFAAGDQVS